MRSFVILLTLLSLCAATAKASVLPYAANTIPGLVEESDIIVRVDGGTIVSSSEYCFVLTALVRSKEKGEVEAGTTIRASYPLSSELRELCPTSTDCPALADALIFLVDGVDPVCSNESRTVLHVMPTNTSDTANRVQQVLGYITAENKLTWAEQVLESAQGDSFSIRSAMAATFGRMSADTAVQELMRRIVLSDEVTPEIRLEAVRVLSATDSPAETEIIRELQNDAGAPTTLQRDSLPYLDRDESTRLLLRDLSQRSNPEVARKATTLLLKLAEEDALTASFGGTVSLATALDIRKAQLVNLEQSGLSLTRKTKAIAAVLDKIPETIGRNMLAEVMESIELFEPKNPSKLKKEKY